MDQENMRIQIKHLKLCKCHRQRHHEDYYLDEICLDQQCQEQYVPICSVCKFENHQFHKTQNFKVFLLDLAQDCFRDMKLNVDFSDKYLIQAGGQLEKAVKNMELIVKQCQNVLNNAKKILVKYNNLILEDAPEKVVVKQNLHKIIQAQDTRSLTYFLQNMKPCIYSNNNRQSFIDDRYTNDDQKSKILYNAETILETMRLNMDKLHKILNDLTEVTNPLKINRNWVERFKDEDLTKDLFRNKSEAFINHIGPDAKPFFESNPKIENFSIYNNNLFEKAQEVRLEQGSYNNPNNFQGSLPELQRLNKKKQFLWQKMANLKDKMIQHTGQCMLHECKQVVPKLFDLEVFEIVKNKNLRSRLNCDVGQQMNNEMGLIKKEYDNIQ